VGSGAFLAYANLTYQAPNWIYTPTGLPLNDTQEYYIASLDYLLTGSQTPAMTWFKDGYVNGNEKVNVVHNQSTPGTTVDSRMALIVYLQELFGTPIVGMHAKSLADEYKFPLYE